MFDAEGMALTFRIRALALAALCAPIFLVNAADAPARIALGVNVAGAPGHPQSLDRYTRLVGRRPDIVMWYQTFGESLYYPSQARAVIRRRVTPMVTWGPVRNGKGIPLATIAAGKEDATIAKAATAAKRFGRPMYIRFAHEMNLHGSLWGSGVNGNRAADYVAAWRHVVAVFRRHGV